MAGVEKELLELDSVVRRVATEHTRPVVVGRGDVLAGRFKLTYKHGEGGMGQVFAAYDSLLECEVAVKLLGQRSADGAVALKREFRAAADIVHPNLVRLHQLFADGAEWFFSMESIQGATLPARLARMPSREPRYIRDVMGQLALGIGALHRAGTLHGDLKPSNFLITSADERVVLLDFGLARSSGKNQPFEIAGTPKYWAPEQERAEVLTEAADWYAFGVVLFETLTGELPGRNPTRDQLAAAPEDLADLCMALFRDPPAARPKEEAILAVLGVQRDRRASSTPAPGPVATSEPSLFGRDAELDVLRGAFHAMAQGERKIVMVHGPSGIGKSTLVREFVRRARAEGAFVLEGRCRERESIGYKAIDSLIDDVVAQLDRLSPPEAAELLPANVSELLMLFPALRKAEVLARASQPPPEALDYARLRLRAVAAFAALIAGLRRLRPLVIWIDDLQWSDSESAVLLGPILSGPDATSVLLVGSYRAGVPLHRPLLDALLASPHVQLPPLRELPLGPLDVGEAERMSRSLLPASHPGSADVVHDVVRDAGGHPLFIVELLHAAQHRHETAGLSPLPVSLVELVTERLQHLPEDARALLELIAIAGAPTARRTLRQTLALTPSRVARALDVLRANRFVRSDGVNEHETLDSHHDRIREIVLQQLTEASRRTYHANLALLLEALSDCPPARLAQHFEAAGEFTRAGHYFIVAADQAVSALAFGHAAELYASGVRLASLTPEALSAVQLRRAEALALAGKGPDAAEIFLAEASTSAHEKSVELRRRAAEELLLAGHLARGLALIEDVLKAVGLKPTRGGRNAILPLVSGRMWLDVRGFAYQPRSENQLTRAQITRLDTAWATAWSLAFTDPIRAAEFQTRHMRWALRAGEPRRVLRALTLEVSSAAARGPRARRTEQLLAAAEASAALTDDVTAHGLLSLARGASEYLQGRLESSIELCLRALDGFGKQSGGALWERMNAQRFVVSALFLLGRMPELAEFLAPLLAEVEGTRNLTAAATFRTGFSTTAWLALDKLQDADRQLALARAETSSEIFQLTQHSLLVGETLRDLYAGEYERAHVRLREAWPRVIASQFLMIGVVRVTLTHLRAAVAAALAHQHSLRGEFWRSRELWRYVRRAARELAGESLPRAQALGLALQAAVDCAEGRRESAQRNLAACAAEFDAQHMLLYRAAAHRRLAEVARGGAHTALAASAEQCFRDQRVVRADRLVAMLIPGFQGS